MGSRPKPSRQRTSRLSRALWLGATVALFSVGCRASVSAKVNTGGDDDELDESVTPVSSTLDTDPLDVEYALNGARHDLGLSEQAKSAASTCSCLAVKVGTATDPAFEWQGGVPRIDPDHQLVFAMSSEGKACEKEPEDSLGASYWGFRQEGEDIVIVVENARFGRPLTSGAVIPKPTGSGRVYLRPASREVPYGRPADGSTHCRLD
ncbi:MAG: hypothetical protein KIT72_17955 [Polyangiaceae bacterium]|nr:hypothetical protein [Polyangiaceae bacterium]MCW5792300.1 hypothetical protein [Polyangiaceae bacterium]